MLGTSFPLGDPGSRRAGVVSSQQVQWLVRGRVLPQGRDIPGDVLSLAS
ncbi:MAG: hypothetical protein LBT97_00780 [Planctomycetota bacterium]|jgi:hypothetical protein|nr:hypothetical protein [Planctomycetota bacterium]